MPSVVRRQARRHPLFRETNAISKRMHIPHPELWRKSLPTKEHSDKKYRRRSIFGDILSPQTRHEHHESVSLLNDVHVEFDDPAKGARQLLEKCGIVPSPSQRSNDESTSLPLPETIMAETETVHHLTNVLSYFQSVASPSHENVKCIARVVSTVGPIGTKCPRWHADHIPVRLIMSILGAGCEYIPEKFGIDDDRLRVVNRRALNNMDEDDTVKANDVIVPPELLAAAMSNSPEPVIKHAKEGDAVLLMGRGWEDKSDAADTDDNKVLAAVHRSPTMLPDQERILLTVDLADWDY